LRRGFVALPLPALVPAIRIKIQHGAIKVRVQWPLSAPVGCVSRPER
jgi:hypothetical protein